MFLSKIVNYCISKLTIPYILTYFITHMTKIITKPVINLNNYLLSCTNQTKYLTCLLILLFSSMGWGQVSNYSFSSSSGTYTSITGGTLILSGTTALDTYVSGALTIPSFTLNGVSYTTAYVTSNGLLSLGTTAPSSTSYSAMNSTTGTGISICPFNADLDRVNSTAATELRFQTIGNEVVFQWTQFKRYLETESFDLQVRLNTSTGAILFVYKLNSGPNLLETHTPLFQKHTNPQLINLL